LGQGREELKGKDSYWEKGEEGREIEEGKRIHTIKITTGER